MAKALDDARDAIGRRAWQDAYDLLTAADVASPLQPEDLESLAITTALLASIEESTQAWARAYNAWLETDRHRAARCAFWLGMGLINHGEMSRGGGWLGRAAKTLEDAGTDCAEAGLIRIPMGLQALHGGDHEAGLGAFRKALAIGERFRDPDLLALGNLGCGQALITMGHTAEGLGALDQAMVAITTDEVMPIVPGIVYCAVILACYDIFDIRRAHEWTKALDAWSAPQQGLVPFRGQCLVHRSQIMQMRGAWAAAMQEAMKARDRLGVPPGQPAIGMAYYQLGELHRVGGRYDDAEEAYRDASLAGHSPQPGLALLRLAQGRADVASASITTALEEVSERSARCRLLPAAVEIALAARDVARARAALDDLADAVGTFDAPLLRASFAAARGAVLLADDDATAALTSLREAQREWQELDVPFEVARTRATIARACRTLGDTDTATLEADAARRAFEGLGATPALEAMSGGSARPGGLTAREAEILKLLATGKTNKAIAEELVISQKTVARHLSNIFTKLGLSTRAEATAYAFKHDLA